MKILRILALNAKRFYYDRAIEQINPMNPDVIKVVRRRARIADALAKEWRAGQ